VREPVGTLLELCIREARIAADQRLALRHRVGDDFEQIGEIEMPGWHERVLRWPWEDGRGYARARRRDK